MQRHFKALFALVKENKAMYITAMLSTVVTVIIGFLTPLDSRRVCAWTTAAG